MTLGRRTYYFLDLPVLRGLNSLLVSTYRFEKTIGADRIQPFIKSGELCAPCYWHQHHIAGSTLIRAWGAEVIRGSANQSGALALRDMWRMMKNGYSIVTTADGPRGPKYEFKMGAILITRIGRVPILPIACAAKRAWYLVRWDDFMLPKPFSRIVIAMGEPYTVPADAPLDNLESHRQAVQETVMSLMQESEQVLQETRG